MASHNNWYERHMRVRGVPFWVRVEDLATVLYPHPALEFPAVCMKHASPRSCVLQHLSLRTSLKKRQLGRLDYLGCSLTTTAPDQRLWCCVHCSMGCDAGHTPWAWLLHLIGVSVQTLVGMLCDCRNTEFIVP